MRALMLAGFVEWREIGMVPGAMFACHEERWVALAKTRRKFSPPILAISPGVKPVWSKASTTTKDKREAW